MPQVLTTNATVLCPHNGQGTSTPSVPTAPRCFVQGGQVLVENDTGVLACPNGPVPCVGYTLRSMGLNSSRIAGRRILLVTDFNTTVTGLPLAMTEAHTTIDDSTPTPVPAGEAPPPAAPATHGGSDVADRHGIATGARVQFGLAAAARAHGQLHARRHVPARTDAHAHQRAGEDSHRRDERRAARPGRLAGGQRVGGLACSR